jgi:hypothetical protein
MIFPVHGKGVDYIFIVPILTCVTAIYYLSIAIRDPSYIP